MGAARLFRWVAAAFLAALAPAAAGHALAADPFVSMGDELAVGKNRTGEACRLKLVGIRTDTGFRRFSLVCEGWTRPSCDIWTFNVGKGFALDKLLTDSAWEKNFSQRLGGCARSLLVSHWAMASQPTVILTTTLFDAYAKNAGRAAALQTAQLKLLGDPATSHPSFWAPFVLVGDGAAP